MVTLPLASGPPLGQSLGSEAIEQRRRLTRLFDEHFDFVWRSLCRLGVPVAAVDDATQQVWLVVLRRVDEIEPSKEKSFLFGTAVRVASEVRRRATRRCEVHDDTPDVPDSGPQPDEVLEQRRARRMLDEILEMLPMALRAVFILYELEEMTAAQIADALSLPPGTVASRLKRARALFDAEVRRRRERSKIQGGVR